MVMEIRRKLQAILLMCACSCVLKVAEKKLFLEIFLGNLKTFLEKEDKISQDIQAYTKATKPEVDNGEETLEAIDKQLIIFEVSRKINFLFNQ